MMFEASSTFLSALIHASTEVVASETAVVAQTAADCNLTLVDSQNMGADIVTLMGVSFILGSLISILCLALLDFIRYSRADSEQ